jgi:hypothetical protein
MAGVTDITAEMDVGVAMVMAMATARATATEKLSPMSDRLTVILPPVLTTEEKQQEAIDFTINDDRPGDGWGDGYHCGDGDGDGFSGEFVCDYGDGNRYGWGDGDGCSETYV